MDNVAAILLAAGRSERMGAFKPLLPFGDKTVIERSVEAFLAAGINSIVIVCGWKAAEIQTHLANDGIRFAINPDPLGDMSSSIASGVKELPQQAKATLISPADLPAIPATVVTEVIRAWLNGSRLVVPTWKERGGHPVLIDQSYFPELLSLDSDEGLRGFLRSHPDEVTRLPVDSQYIARDLDTWDDYRELHKEIFGTTPPELGSKA